MAGKNIVIMLVCSMILQVVFSHPSKRHINADENKETDERSCGQSTPCGWAVYNKMSRSIDYFMKNKCSCLPNKECFKDEDDISVGAYVYRCKTKNS